MWDRRRSIRSLAAALLGSAGVAGAYKLDPNSTDSIKSVSRSLADDMIDTYYFGNKPGNVPGILPQPYYWWEGGALMGALIDYWYYTGDTKFNDLTSAALLAQVGEYNDYMPKAQIMNEGNDDQGFWGVAVMAAAEYKFPDPPKDKPQWLALAQAVFNTQVSRWDPDHCGGGLRWQIFQWNNGFNYKNTISQACLFNLAARLALYTGNNTYAEWADKVWDWTWAVGFIDKDRYWIYDGGHIPNNCTNVVPYVWTYNTGAFMHGIAAMYNHTTGARREVWRDRLDKLVNASKVFFNGTNSDIMSEIACEPVGLCDVDQQSFKAYLSRWMAATTKWAPWTEDRLMPLLRSSAVAAAAQCTAGANGRMCGLKWYEGSNDGLLGLGQQMAVLEVVLALMAKQVAPPVTDETGGTSVGDPGAGGGDMGHKDTQSIVVNWPPMTDRDRAGAYVLTVAVLLGLVFGMIFLLMDEADKRTIPERWSDMRSAVEKGGVAGVFKKSESESSPSSNGSDDGSGKPKGGGGPVSPDSEARARNGTSAVGGHEDQRTSRVTVQQPSALPVRFSSVSRTASLGNPSDDQGLPPDSQHGGGFYSHGHRKARSMPSWNDLELGLPMSGSGPPQPLQAGAVVHQWATQQLERASSSRSSSKRSAAAEGGAKRPASMAT